MSADALAPSPSPLQLPAKPALAVAFVYLRAQAGDDFFADVPFLWSAGELRQDGMRAEVFEVRYERDAPAYNALLDDDLMARLQSNGYGLVVLQSCWRPGFIERLRGLGLLICETAPASVREGERVDFAIRHFTRDRQPLRQLCARLQAGDDLTGIANLSVRQQDSMMAVGSERPVPPTPAARLPFCPLPETTLIGKKLDLRGEQPPVRRTLDTNDGCPFAKVVDDNPAFDGVDLSHEAVTHAGCSFCFMGGDYKALPWRETVEIHLDQIEVWQRTGLDEVVLRDQHAIRYLPYLFERAAERKLPPFGVLVPGRGDAILRYGETLKAAAEAASQTAGMWFSLYLIGFESFSEAQLQRFNKGVVPEQYGKALQELRALHSAHPDAFRLYAYGSSSFILWEPWATLDDLRANVRFIDEHAVMRLSSGFASTRLRLYPNLPLYWKAKADGLLTTGPAADDRGAAQTGYAAEAGWRYADGRVAAVEELVRRLLQHTRPTAGVDVVGAATAWATARWPAALPPQDAAALAETASALAAAVTEAADGWRVLRQRWRPNQSKARPPEATGSWQAQADARQQQRRRRAKGTADRAERVLRLGAACNNQCRTCIGHRDHFETDSQRMQHLARKSGEKGERVTFAGREPTLLRGLLPLIREAIEAGANGAELVTNGRALSVPKAARRLARAGVSSLIIKRHRAADADEDAYVQAPGAAEQATAGMAAAKEAGIAFRVLLIPTTEAPQELSEMVRWAHKQGARGVQVEVRIAEVALGACAQWAAAIDEAVSVAAALGLELTVAGD